MNFTYNRKQFRLREVDSFLRLRLGCGEGGQKSREARAGKASFRRLGKPHPTGVEGRRTTESNTTESNTTESNTTESNATESNTTESNTSPTQQESSRDEP